MIAGYFEKHSSSAPLAGFRLLFGIMVFASTVRFWLNGWIETLYIQPKYFFSYFGFEFIAPPGNYIYLLFLICAISSLFVAFGYFYRIAIILLFLSFTYIELIDKTTYLNHYYFVSLVSFMLIFLPANSFFSIDSLKDKKLSFQEIPAWCLDSLKLMVCILYFYAGVAKINSDWLFHALPLKIWLPARNDMPLIGFLFNYSWVHYAFSWLGCAYDLAIPFLLWNKKTRLSAYFAVVIFHGLTAALFPIGIFPLVMIVTALVFFSPELHLKYMMWFENFFKKPELIIGQNVRLVFNNFKKPFLLSLFGLFFVFQLLFPFRYMLYPGEIFWTEQGYRFSWRVMLMEKAGFSEFKVKDANGKYATVNNRQFLTVLQEKMMSTQPDMTLQYAHMLARHYEKQGFISPEVYVDSYVTLNGRRGRTLIDPNRDLAKVKDSFNHKDWILALNDEIKGF